VVGAEGTDARGLLTVAGAVVLLSPLLLALPVQVWVRDLRGTVFFYAWTAGLIVGITALAHIDGGASSPLTLLLFLTLTFAVLTYPPLGVAAVGALVVAVHLALVATSSAPSASTTSTTAVLALYTAMTCWTARNQWDTQDQQHLLAARLVSLASTDPLTQCLNRGALHERLDALAVTASSTTPVATLLIDLDGFKQVNDTLGHAAGDAVLVDVARVLRTTTRETDCVARLGGDEFVVVLHGPSAEQAQDTAERLRAGIGEQCASCGVTASIGLTTTTSALPGSELLLRADRAMYVAKHGGRDRISAASV
jgi:diguanylate cyclase (GGDEF)-like protein